MLSLRMYGVDQFHFDELPEPEPEDEGLVIKVKAAAICGTDVRMLSSGCSHIDKDHPLALGHEFAGVIAKLGKKTKGYSIGGRVSVAPNIGCGKCDLCVSGNTHLCNDYQAFGIHRDGSFAEYVNIPASAVSQGNITLLPDNIDYVSAALAEPLSCAINGMEHYRVFPGDQVLIIGAGAIGLIHAKLARLSGASLVVISDLVEERLQVCKQIDPTYVPVLDISPAHAKSLTDGHGFDVVITACPSAKAQQSALDLAAVNGRICFFGGLPSGRSQVELNSNLIHYKQLLVTGSTRANLRQYRYGIKMLSAGYLSVRELVTGYGALRDFPILLDAARHARGLKNVVLFD